jgi:hypothetical protein
MGRAQRNPSFGTDRRYDAGLSTVALPGDGETNDKLIGVYSNVEEAEAAKARKLQFEGFREAPEGFQISPYEVNRDAWSEGYITV